MVSHFGIARGIYVTTYTKGSDPQVTKLQREEFLQWLNVVPAWFPAILELESIQIFCLGPVCAQVPPIMFAVGWELKSMEMMYLSLLASPEPKLLRFVLRHSHKTLWTPSRQITSNLNLAFVHGAYSTPWTGLKSPPSWLIFQGRGESEIS